MTELSSFDVFNFVILPLLIFLSRIVDVSLDTIRIILISKGYKRTVPLVGFFQVLVWIIVITRIMQNLDNWLCYIAYAGGFAAGNYIGMIIEEKIALGYEMVRVITRVEANDLIGKLKEKGYGTTSVKALGNLGEVAVIYIIVSRKMLKDVINLIAKYNPQALYTVEDIRFVSKQVNYNTGIPSPAEIPSPAR